MLDGSCVDILGTGESETKGNEASTVIRVSYQGRTFLFTGDMDAKREDEATYNPRADVLKVAHHGSKTSSTEAFITRVKPGLAVISVGTHNRYGHPHMEILKRLERIGAKVMRTDKSGCIIVEIVDNNLGVKTLG